MKKSILTLAVIAVAGFVFGAELIYEAADGSAAIRVYNNGSESVSITIASGGAGAANTVVIGTTTNTIDGSGAIDTVAELAAVIGACTNSAGSMVLIVDTDCAVSTDSTDGELLDGTYTAAAGAWAELLWDTSDTLSYDLYLQDESTAAWTKTRRGFATIDKVYGNPLGTGDLTVSIYVGGTKVWEKLCVEPDLISATNDAVIVVNNNIPELPLTDLGIPVPANKPALVRMKRATTATTGHVGMCVE